jgi:hypothetical protein
MALAAACSLSLAMSPAVASQAGPELNVQCVSIAGAPTGDAWREASLQDAIAVGSAELTVVSSGEDCAIPEDGTACVTVAGSAPASGWAPDTLTGAIAAGRARIVRLAAADACAQVVAETREIISTSELSGARVLDSAIVVGDSSTAFVATILNPNTNGWAAQDLPLSVSVRDEAGEEIEVESASVSLLPGQTGAVIGFLTADGPHRVQVRPRGAESNWVPTALSPDLLVVSGVTRLDDPATGFVTTGSISNRGEVQQEGVSIIAVHRNRKGRIIGAESSVIRLIPAGRTVVFELPNRSGIGSRQVAETAIYFQLGSVL